MVCSVKSTPSTERDIKEITYIMYYYGYITSKEPHHPFFRIYYRDSLPSLVIVLKKGPNPTPHR